MKEIWVMPEPSQVPLAQLTEYAAIVNVSDSPCRTFELMLPTCEVGTWNKGWNRSFPEHFAPSFWFPIEEQGKWGYGPFYAAAKVYDWIPEGSKMMIHCHGGVNRSWCVADAIHLSSPGSVVRPLHQTTGTKTSLSINITEGHIPRFIVEFLAMRHQYPDYSILGLLGVMGLSHGRDEQPRLTSTIEDREL